MSLRFYNTKQLSCIIMKKFFKLNRVFPNVKLDIYFTKNNEMSSEGLYVFSDNNYYHYVYSDRGNETIHKKTKDIFEISFWIFESITSELAFDFASTCEVKNCDYRKIAFKKQLEMLDILGEEYKIRGEAEIKEILKLYP